LDFAGVSDKVGGWEATLRGMRETTAEENKEKRGVKTLDNNM